MILISYIGVCTFEYVVSSSRLYRFALTERVLHQSTQLGDLDVSAGSILEPGGDYVRIYFRLRPLPKF